MNWQTIEHQFDSLHVIGSAVKHSAIRTLNNKIKTLFMSNEETKRIVYSGNLFEIVHEDYKFSTGIKTFESARRGPGTRIIVTSDDKKILLTREYRNELGTYDIRLPGGKVFDTLNEYGVVRKSNKNILEYAREAAIRELEEETGYKTKELKFLDISKCGATIEWDLYFFHCKQYESPTDDFRLQEGEDITTFWEDIKKAKRLCLTGIISEERSALRILRYL